MRAISQMSGFTCVLLGLISAFVLGSIFGDITINRQQPDLSCYVAR
jgi:hypothetical protein